MNHTHSWRKVTWLLINHRSKSAVWARACVPACVRVRSCVLCAGPHTLNWSQTSFWKRKENSSAHSSASPLLFFPLPHSSWVLNSATEKVTCVLCHKELGSGGEQGGGGSWTEAAGSADSERLDTCRCVCVCVHPLSVFLTHVPHPTPQQHLGSPGESAPLSPSPTSPPLPSLPPPTPTCELHPAATAQKDVHCGHMCARVSKQKITGILTEKCAEALSVSRPLCTLSNLYLHPKQLCGDWQAGRQKGNKYVSWRHHSFLTELWHWAEWPRWKLWGCLFLQSFHSNCNFTSNVSNTPKQLNAKSHI